MKNSEATNVTQRVFGELSDGTIVKVISLTNEYLRAEILTRGGVLRSLQVNTSNGPVEVVLGLPDLAAYVADTDNLGILVGRYGNRIAGAQYDHAGVRHQLDANEGRNHLHGGRHGFGRRLWTVLEQTQHRLVLALTSPAGEGGYPGTLHVTAIFELSGAALLLTYHASTDAETPVNLTHHPYFNLAGDPHVPADRQWLRVPASHFLPVDAELIPTGEVRDVTGGAFDFREAVEVRLRRTDEAQVTASSGYDHCLVLDDDADCSAELYSPHSGVAMRIASPMPALQFYEGQALDHSQPQLGRGFCLEPQGFPDAPNHPQFPTAMLSPSQIYLHPIRYTFAHLDNASSWNEVMEELNARAGT
ncbi:aldose epimerase family protein [Stenotrophomonas maltophilia]|uniref:aldose epimerase family protein n=1 Tax=Stenotrophomonas maltophilia TaxID=40324 RepID=UPI00209C4B1E|nr:aldose epimerase family protein [Stenotrophomonas maltophilia]